jgi:hypothetical protein
MFIAIVLSVGVRRKSGTTIDAPDGAYRLAFGNPDQCVDGLNGLDLAARRHRPAQGVQIVANFA